MSSPKASPFISESDRVNPLAKRDAVYCRDMNTAATLADRYVEINREIALITAKHAANDGTANISRLVLRAAALQARANNDDRVVADAMRAFCAEIGQ